MHVLVVGGCMHAGMHTRSYTRTYPAPRVRTHPQRLRELVAPLDVNESAGRLTAAAVAYVDEALLLQAMSGAGVTYARQKAQRLVQTATTLQEKHGGDAPQTLQELMELPGVGPKVRTGPRPRYTCHVLCPTVLPVPTSPLHHTRQLY